MNDTGKPEAEAKPKPNPGIYFPPACGMPFEYRDNIKRGLENLMMETTCIGCLIYTCSKNSHYDSFMLHQE